MNQPDIKATTPATTRAEATTATRATSRPIVALSQENTNPPTRQEPEKLLRAQAVAEYLDCSIAQAYRLLKSGVIPCIHAGNLVRVRKCDLERFILDQVGNATRVAHLEAAQ